MITQFTINLNKGEDIAEREARWRKRREIITLTVLIILVLILSVFNVGQYQMIEGIITTKQRLSATSTVNSILCRKQVRIFPRKTFWHWLN